MRPKVTHQIGKLRRDIEGVEPATARRMPDVVRDAAESGNRRAKEHASEQHTMFSDVDIDYPLAFTVERIRATVYVYGPDDSLPQGTKASGYELGSVNQASPHRNLDRSVEFIGPEFERMVDREQGVIWKRAGF